jgi:hypothetical protein
MNRRSFTARMAAATGVSPLSTLLTAGNLSLGIVSLLPDIREAARLGRLVLARDAGAAAAGEALVAVLEVTGGRNPHGIREAFAERRRADFAMLDTQVVDGWVLARAEAQLCAACVRVERP